VLTAQRNLFNSELALAKTRRAQLVSVVQLYKALGGGWAPPNQAEPEGQPVAQAQPQ
jgi:multidrug efflux system outer membrane protein